MNRKRILYVQYTNPAGYPPLEHSSRIFAGSGWHVLFLGTGAYGADILDFPPHPNITVRRRPFQKAGWRQKLGFLYFAIWVVAWCVRWRPAVVYASDVFSTPAALLARMFSKILIYHEHDSPGTTAPKNLFQRICLAARAKLARRASLCVLPNERRAEVFRDQTGTTRPVPVVWNCPMLSEVAAPRNGASGRLRILYHGSIVPERLPMTVVEALQLLSRPVTLVVAGYETVGSSGYVAQLRHCIAGIGSSHSFEYLGAIPQRSDLIAASRSCDIGLAFMPMETRDLNEHAMTGASNKPFDYLAGGLALLVSDLPDWRRMFVEPGYALACNPADPASIAQAIQWYIDHPREMRAMGELGRKRIAEDWNYEARFQPVFSACEGYAQCS